MTNDGHIIIAACQPPEFPADEEDNLSTILAYCQNAEAHGASLVCFPECYLQGYIIDPEHSRHLAVSLDSKEFSSILDCLRVIDPILVFGLIEASEGALFNTAVVVQRGQLIGFYRKTQLLPGELDVFTAGSEFPVFNVGGLKFGINICYDLNFPHCAAAIAGKGASLLVCPCNNMMKYHSAIEWKEKHNAIRARRCIESNLWLLSSDVTGERDGRVSYGPTAVIDPTGHVVAQVELEKPGMIFHRIAVGIT